MARASDLSLNRYGEVENWPEGFFGDEVGEVAAIAKAGLKKKNRGAVRMSPVVVDTNVGIAANGDAKVDPACQLACAEPLERAMTNGVVAVDDGGRILDEYETYFSFSGAAGIGHAFFRYVYDRQYHGARVRRFAITPSKDDRRGFEEPPENTSDPSDRKFLAVAVVAKAVVVNGKDSDWSQSS